MRKRDEVSRLKVENGHEDGRAVYEVEFHVGDYEYNYDIDAETYEVLDWDREIDD
ncbi:MAG TPA: hypothetical protein DCF49_04925 [Lachnospiraceae bacterium]|nr:hypothetical protein [Lachnospiraceae bacterium]